MVSFYDLMAEAEANGEEPVEGAIRRYREGVAHTKHIATGRGKRQARQLLTKMLALGLSKYEPDPISAIEAKLAEAGRAGFEA